jgi:hypothetical protein
MRGGMCNAQLIVDDKNSNKKKNNKYKIFFCSKSFFLLFIKDF